MVARGMVTEGPAEVLDGRREERERLDRLLASISGTAPGAFATGECAFVNEVLALLRQTRPSSPEP
jgi:hypothetical protein